MKKITLTESDLLKIVNKVLNEQKKRKFNKDEIDILHHIFERELKPPFRPDEVEDSDISYYNRDGQEFGVLRYDEEFDTPTFLFRNSIIRNIKFKVCQVFEFPYDTADWWVNVRHILRSWMEDQLNIELDEL